MPASIWLKTHIQQEGPFMVARTAMVGSGQGSFFTVRVDMRPILKTLIAYHKKLHDDCVGCDPDTIIGWNPIDTVKKISRSKAVRSVTGIASKANPITMQASLGKKLFGKLGVRGSKTAKLMALATNPLIAQGEVIRKAAKDKRIRGVAKIAAAATNPLTLQAIAAEKIATNKNVRKRVVKAIVASNPFLAQLEALKKSGELAKNIALRKQKFNAEALKAQLSVFKELSSSTNGSKGLMEAATLLKAEGKGVVVPILALAKAGRLKGSTLKQLIKVAHPGLLQADLILEAVSRTPHGKEAMAAVFKKLPSSKWGLLGAAALNPLAAQSAVLAKAANREKVKAAARNPYVAAGVAAAAAAYPPVGVPAAEALAKANATIEAIEKGEKIVAKVRAISEGSKDLTRVKRELEGKSREEAARALKDAATRSRVITALAARRVSRKIERSAVVKASLASALEKKKEAEARIASLQNAAKYDPNASRRDAANKALAVLDIAAQPRAKLEAIDRNMSPQAAQGQQGILITNQGPIRGKFVSNTTITSSSPDILMLALRSELGQFTRIGGECVGCGLLGV